MKGILFDVDGVILDSQAFWNSMASNLLRSLNIEPEQDLDTKINSLSLEEGIHYLNTTYKISLSLEDIQKFITHYYQEEVTLKGDIQEYIQSLYSKYPLYIVTSNDLSIIEMILNRFHLSYFTKIYANQDKSNMNTYLNISKELNLELYLLDDSDYALEAANKANIHTIKITQNTIYEKIVLK